MSKDLEEQLDELGPAYREVVSRLRAAAAGEFGATGEGGRAQAHPARLGPWLWTSLLAASLLLALGLAVFVQAARGPGSQASSPLGLQAAKRPGVYTVRVTDAAREYTLAVVRSDEAVQEMIRTQKPDGGWQNDFLTRRNAEALRHAPGEAARIAYKKAVRNLRAKGCRPY